MDSRKTVSQSKPIQDTVERLVMQSQQKQAVFHKNAKGCSRGASRKKDT